MKGIAHNGYEGHRGKREVIFTKEELQLLRKAERIVRLLPERTPDGQLIRCHEVARIVGSLLKLPVQDGKYGMCEHSWCWTREPEPDYHILRVSVAPRILDPYAVGSLPVVRLLDSGVSVPHLGWSYMPGLGRNDVKKGFVASEVKRIRRML
jgi:hypothetical protein